ncbi:hypothetical protein P3T36_002686 [Kitasatospora sp. MAP12-15]|uniref:hypothetical protein n=1 Tax=unclassified Kitasatospora TaxID=2633591 RepID=UPI0024756025|nr:hypothetical protein [Kitasatospora sp. MAP12-44]MDH6113865.1 hypothetical protein [Kitasatospora sp. MAP12-44]
MTSTSQPCAFAPSERDPVARIGEWLFVPDSRNAAGDVRPGYLSRTGERVSLPHTSCLLADFLRKIHRLESDLAMRISPPLFSVEP